MDKYKLIKLLIFCMIFTITGCRTFQTIPEPSKLNYNYNLENSIRQLEQEVIAEKKLKQDDSGKNIPPKKRDPSWSQIRGQSLDPQKQFALSELIDIAFKNNPSTKQSWENARLALTKEKQAESKLFPQANVSITWNREKKVANSRSGDLNEIYYGPDFKVTYLLLDFGGRGANIEEMSQMLVSADFQYNQSIQDLLRDIEKYYYEYFSSQLNVQAKQEDVNSTNVDYESAQARFSADLATKLDVLQARSNKENALYALEGARGDLKIAKANLAQALGVSADTDFEIAVPTKEIPTQIKEEDITSLIEEAMLKRPDIGSRLAQLKAKRAALKSANSNLWPTLNLGGETYRNQYDYLKFNRDRNHDYDYLGYLSLDWDIFDGFSNIYKKRQAQRELDIEYDKLLQAEISASSDVWTKYYNFNTALEKFKYSQSFLESSTEAYSLALESYNSGLKSILDLLQSQSSLSEARSKFVNSKKDVYVGLVELAHATGSLYTKEIKTYE